MTGGWSFAFSRRWFGYLAVVILFAIACVGLSQWQFDRREQARAEIERVENNWDAAPAAIGEVLPGYGDFDVDDTWRRVEVTGRYLTDDETLVRGRPFDGKPGFAVLVPFLTDDGSVLMIDRGWVPVGNSQDSPDAVPAAPEGEVTVTARLRAGEPIVPGRSAPEGQMATIHLPDFAERLEEPTYTAAYGALDAEDPAVADMPFETRRPAADEGPHLSYAFQWIAFGVLAFIGLGWAVRHEYRMRNEEDPAVQAHAERQRRKREAKGPTDADVEDAMLDEPVGRR